MIEFLTLLLGLVAGGRTVEVAAAPPVASVELHVDGRVAGRRERPPWRFEIDLGPELAPHELVAIGFDADGDEVARVTQWLNVPRGSAEARIVLERDAEGWPTAARLTWASLWSGQPEAVDVWFDGVRLSGAGPREFELPAYDRERIHVLSAELHFPHGQRTHAEVSFGGVFGERLATELTAVPVLVSGRRALRRLRSRLTEPDRGAAATSEDRRCRRGSRGVGGGGA